MVSALACQVIDPLIAQQEQPEQQQPEGETQQQEGHEQQPFVQQDRLYYCPVCNTQLYEVPKSWFFQTRRLFRMVTNVTSRKQTKKTNHNNTIHKKKKPRTTAQQSLHNAKKPIMGKVDDQGHCITCLNQYGTSPSTSSSSSSNKNSASSHPKTTDLHAWNGSRGGSSSTTGSTNSSSRSARTLTSMTSHDGSSLSSTSVGAGETVYIGGFNIAGHRHGSGELIWNNGDHYVGSFVNGTREGHGILYFGDGTW